MLIVTKAPRAVSVIVETFMTSSEQEKQLEPSVFRPEASGFHVEYSRRFMNAFTS